MHQFCAHHLGFLVSLISQQIRVIPSSAGYRISLQMKTIFLVIYLSSRVDVWVTVQLFQTNLMAALYSVKWRRIEVALSWLMMTPFTLEISILYVSKTKWKFFKIKHYKTLFPQETVFLPRFLSIEGAVRLLMMWFSF